jgi:hypothetical protein
MILTREPSCALNIGNVHCLHWSLIFAPAVGDETAAIEASRFAAWRICFRRRPDVKRAAAGQCSSELFTVRSKHLER